MANLNRYKFTFGKKTLTLTTEHDNLFMEEIAKVATEKYQAIKEQMPGADDETIALLLAINSLSTQLSREIEFDDKEQELKDLRNKLVAVKQEQSKIEDSLCFRSFSYWFLLGAFISATVGIWCCKFIISSWQ